MNALTPQQSEILKLLQDAGTNGVNSYGKAREIALQLPAVIEQLQKHGYIIKTRRHRNRSVDYILLHTPEGLKQTPEMIARPQGWTPGVVQEEDRPQVTVEELEGKIQALRDEYRTASLSRREIIIRQAKALQIAKDKLEQRQTIQAP